MGNQVGIIAQLRQQLAADRRVESHEREELHRRRPQRLLDRCKKDGQWQLEGKAVKTQMRPPTARRLGHNAGRCREAPCSVRRHAMLCHATWRPEGLVACRMSSSPQYGAGNWASPVNHGRRSHRRCRHSLTKIAMAAAWARERHFQALLCLCCLSNPQLGPSTMPWASGRRRIRAWQLASNISGARAGALAHAERARRWHRG